MLQSRSDLIYHLPHSHNLFVYFFCSLFFTFFPRLLLLHYVAVFFFSHRSRLVTLIRFKVWHSVISILSPHQKVQYIKRKKLAGVVLQRKRFNFYLAMGTLEWQCSVATGNWTQNICIQTCFSIVILSSCWF